MSRHTQRSAYACLPGARARLPTDSDNSPREPHQRRTREWQNSGGSTGRRGPYQREHHVGVLARGAGPCGEDLLLFGRVRVDRRQCCRASPPPGRAAGSRFCAPDVFACSFDGHIALGFTRRHNHRAHTDGLTASEGPVTNNPQQTPKATKTPSPGGTEPQNERSHPWSMASKIAGGSSGSVRR